MAPMRRDFESVSAPMATMTLANLSKFHARMLRKQGDKVMTVGAYTFTHTEAATTYTFSRGMPAYVSRIICKAAYDRQKSQRH